MTWWSWGVEFEFQDKIFKTIKDKIAWDIETNYSITWFAIFNYTAKILFLQSSTLYSDYTVTEQWQSPLLTAVNCHYQLCIHSAARSCQRWLHPLHCPATMQSLCRISNWWKRSCAMYTAIITLQQGNLVKIHLLAVAAEQVVKMLWSNLERCYRYWMPKFVYAPVPHTTWCFCHLLIYVS